MGGITARERGRDPVESQVGFTAISVPTLKSAPFIALVQSTWVRPTDEGYPHVLRSTANPTMAYLVGKLLGKQSIVAAVIGSSSGAGAVCGGLLGKDNAPDDDCSAGHHRPDDCLGHAFHYQGSPGKAAPKIAHSDRQWRDEEQGDRIAACYEELCERLTCNDHSDEHHGARFGRKQQGGKAKTSQRS